ncbi:MAG: hypothetical protein CTY28_08610 [Hyphomicrobium sp.]|nr:MAG: hypothetical protein CTY28_08610 [Hyphomicrobium sp.]
MTRDPGMAAMERSMSARVAKLMSNTTAIRIATLTGASAILAAFLTVAPVKAAVAGELVGTWSGTGTVTLANGAREKARCRASYISAGGRTYAMSATCATAAAKVSQTAIVSQNTKNRFGGTFYNPEFGVTGRIRIILSGARQTVYLSGSSGHATFNMHRR